LNKNDIDLGGFAGLKEHRLVMSSNLWGRYKNHGTFDGLGNFLYLEDGLEFSKGDVQVQSTGKEGFSHNEINPNNTKNRMLQLWFKPEHLKKHASYKIYKESDAKFICIYGKNTEFENSTSLKIIKLKLGENYTYEYKFQAYIFKGRANVNSDVLIDGNLFEDENLNLTALEDTHFLLITLN
jgi:quercetin 2,3-dioxygenase